MADVPVTQRFVQKLMNAPFKIYMPEFLVSKLWVTFKHIFTFPFFFFFFFWKEAQ